MLSATSNNIQLRNSLNPVVPMCCCRWREGTSPNGSPQRQSNARFVQWSDGSWQLLVGDEVLDVKESDIRMDHSFLYARQQGILQVQPPCRLCQASKQAHGGPSDLLSCRIYILGIPRCS